MELSSITNRIWTILILIILCAAVGYFFTYDVYNQYVAANSELNTLNEKSEILRQNLATVDDFTSSYEARKDDAKTTELALPAKSADVPNILAGLGDLAGASGVVLSSFQMTEPEDSELAGNSNLIQTITITLGGSGSYASLEDFIKRLESHLRLMDVQRVSVDTQGENSNLAYQIVLKTYFQK